MSEITEHNLTNFFEGVWGMQVSQDAKDRVAGLPNWMPAVGGLSGSVMTQPNTALSFDLAGRGLSHDGTAELVDVTNPEHGTMSLVDDLWVYTPNQDFSGQDQFTYGIRSSTGHVHTSTVDIKVSDHGVQMDIWTGIPGSELTDLRRSPKYPDQPDQTSVIETFSSPVDQLDEYGVRLSAYLIPPEDGDYTFWIASDDQGELWLSPNSTRDGLIQLARVENYTAPLAWTATPQQRSEPVALLAGDAYYIEALMKEGGGGDHLAIAWSRDAAEPRLIPSEYLFITLPEQPDGGIPAGDAMAPMNDGGIATDDAARSMQDAQVSTDTSGGQDGMADGRDASDESSSESGCACDASNGNGNSFWLAIILVSGVYLRRRTLGRVTRI